MGIIDHILEGAQKAGGHLYRPTELGNGYKRKGYVIEADRRQAIRLAITISDPGDTVLIAGKGHETYQILRSATIDFDDRQEARDALSAVCGRKP
jgi:UDP-N-acetylmuramyl tripeptide synthase